MTGRKKSLAYPPLEETAEAPAVAEPSPPSEKSMDQDKIRADAQRRAKSLVNAWVARATGGGTGSVGSDTMTSDIAKAIEQGVLHWLK